MKPAGPCLKKEDWEVVESPLLVAQRMVQELHYAGGGSNTAVHVHGLVPRGQPKDMRGIAWWLPPTRVAAESVDSQNWQRVLSLTRLVISPEMPTNAASFLLAASTRRIRREGKWKTLLTYADESQGHRGTIYHAANWIYLGKTGPYPRWVAEDGRQVAPKATVNRTKAEMEALGHRKKGTAYLHKFCLRLGR